jgi:hypothetical protein
VPAAAAREYDHVAQIGQVVAQQEAGLPGGTEFGAEFGEHFRQAQLAKRIEHQQMPRARLPDDVFNLCRLEKGIDRHDRRAETHRGERADHPLQRIGHPQHHSVAAPHADARETCRQVAHALAEPPVAQALHFTRVARGHQCIAPRVAQRDATQRLPDRL